MPAARDLDVERVICRVADLEACGSRAFTLGGGPWPLQGFVVKLRSEIRAYVNRCPHQRHPLNLMPHRFLTPDGSLILCNSHGALFEKHSGYCVAGPCAGKSLQALPVTIESGFVVLADDPVRYAEE